MRGRKAFVLSTILSLCVLLPACSSEPSDDIAIHRSPNDTVTVGSFDFPESRLLAELYSQALEAAGYPVRRAFDLGSREFVGPALMVGLVDLVPEYAGTAAQFFGFGKDAPSSDPVVTRAQLVRSLAGRPIAALGEAEARNANAFVVTRETAEQDGLSTLSDLARISDDLVFGGAAECAVRPLCLVGLQKVYDISFKQVASLGEPDGPATLSALRNGYVDVAQLFTSDPALADGDLVELRDDRGLQPAENVTPLVRSEVLTRYGPRFAEVLDAVSSRLTTEELRALNASAAGRADVAPVDVGTVAADWLGAVGSR
jgi:osmoprotectant transport system substrate-binding protein